MNPDDFTNPPGKIVEADDNDGGKAYLPSNLPNSKGLDLDAELFKSVSITERVLGNLSGKGEDLQNPNLLMMPYLFREAFSSTKIEGTQTSLDQVLKADAQGDTTDRDIKEVNNYRDATLWGLDRLEKEPISTHFIERLHAKLFEGIEDQPEPTGRFRDTQNYVGINYTPPPPEHVESLMEDLVEFMDSEEDNLPDLVKLALFHYQFEAIHPFADGNGRIGRILIILYLEEKEILSEPLLYLSDFFDSNRSNYFRKLLRVSAKGEYESWVKFFLRGIEKQSRDAIERSNQLKQLEKDFKSDIKEVTSRANRLEALDVLFKNPIVTKPKMRDELGLSNYQAASRIVEDLCEAGILEERGGHPKTYECPEIKEVIASPRQQEADVNLMQ